MKRIVRQRLLTPEEAAKYQSIREQVATEFMETKITTKTKQARISQQLMRRTQHDNEQLYKLVRELMIELRDAVHVIDSLQQQGDKKNFGLISLANHFVHFTPLRLEQMQQELKNIKA